MLKVEHKFEKYLDILEGKLLNSFINFRMCNITTYLSKKDVGVNKTLSIENAVYVILMK